MKIKEKSLEITNLSLWVVKEVKDVPLDVPPTKIWWAGELVLSLKFPFLNKGLFNKACQIVSKVVLVVAFAFGYFDKFEFTSKGKNPNVCTNVELSLSTAFFFQNWFN